MPASIYRSGKYTWVHDVRGNFVCVDNGELKATIVGSEWEPWQIILHHGENALLFRPGRFDDPKDAMAKAGEILDAPDDECFCAPNGHGYLSNLVPRRDQ